MSMSRPRKTTACAALALLLTATACEDNIGRVFDPNVGGPGAGEGTVQAAREGSDARDGRPRVRAAFPEGAGWPSTVPIVVEFSESLNESSVRPSMSGGTDGRVFVRPQGMPQALPAGYDFLMGGRVVVIRPTPALMDTGTPFEVVVDPEVRDMDGVRFGGSEPQVVATFSADQDPMLEDGRILTVLPRNNATDVLRETAVHLVFDKPANASSVTTASFRVRTAGGADVTGGLSFPLRTAGVEDGRVVRFTPDNVLDGATDHEVVVDDTITFGSAGVLDFGNRTPFSRFGTLAFEAPVSVTVGNLVPGFPDKINRANVDNLQLDVQVSASAGQGDRVLARIYGLDRSTQPADDLRFVERRAVLPMAGAQTVTVDFSGALGTAAAPIFDDGPVTLAVQLQRGTRHSGFVLADSGNDPAFDVTFPSITEVGPPNVPGTDDVLTDQEHLAFYGTASEELGAASLTDGSSTADLFAAAPDGRFVLAAIPLGRRTTPLGYTLNLTDAAGNMAPTALAGMIRQRGVITGAQAGTLTVEAYDEATLQPLSGVTAVLDPGTPAVPAAGQQTMLTGADGRATFTGLTSPTHTVTLLLAGYHLRTLYDTPAAHVSLPLRPIATPVASFAGNATFTPLPNVRALVGNNLLDDPRRLAVATSSGSPTVIPTSAILPNRPQVVTAFAGVVEPAAVPTFSFLACQMCGVDLLTPTPPAAPAAGGTAASVDLVLGPAVGSAVNLVVTYTKDFSTAAGLDVLNLVGDPVVRFTVSLEGLGGQALAGVGFTTAAGAGMYTVNGSYGLTPILSLIPFAPLAWVSTQAEDGVGNLSRHRALLTPGTGTVFDVANPPGVPVVVAPGGPFTGSPAVVYEDRLDPAVIPLGLAVTELTATDALGRQWKVLLEDTDGTGAQDTVQLPDLSGISAQGLSAGTWRIGAESFLFLSAAGAGAGDLVLADRFRTQVNYARSALVDHTVN